MPANVDQAETLWLTYPPIAQRGIDFELASGGTFSGTRLSGQRLNQELTPDLGPCASANMKDRLPKGGPGRIDVVHLQRGSSQRTEADAPKRVTEHVVGALAVADSTETLLAGRWQVSGAPQRFAQEDTDAGGGRNRPAVSGEGPGGPLRLGS